MNLAVFDIDDTLTRTEALDAVYFIQAIKAIFEVEDFDTDWSTYRHTTDSYISRAIFRSRHGRDPNEREVQRLRDLFVELLRGALDRDHARVREVPGGRDMLDRLRRDPQWRAAIATGGWRVSALLKLSSAGIAVDDLPAAFADDALSREEIVGLARDRALRAYGVEGFDKIVCIGDAVWDVRAARRLQCGFVGIGSDAKRERLFAEGAARVLPDYSDPEAFLTALAEAAVPDSRRLHP